MFRISLNPRIPVFAVLCALAVTLSVVPARAQNPPPSQSLDSVLDTNSAAGYGWAKVSQAAQSILNGANGAQTKYKSSKVEDVTFEGTFTAGDAANKLAVLSDDGVDVYLYDETANPNSDPKANAVKVFPANGQSGGFHQPQALPDLPHSLHPIDTHSVTDASGTAEDTLISGHVYYMRVDYSNTIYTGNNDIDGCSVFEYSDVDVQISAAASIPTIERVKLNNTTYGAGITTPLTVKTTDAASVKSVQLSWKGLYNAQGNSVGDLIMHFYNPALHDDNSFQDEGKEDTPFGVTTSTTKNLILMLSLAHASPGINAGTYTAKVKAAGRTTLNGQDVSFSQILSFSVTVGQINGAASSSYDCEASNGPYRRQRSSYGYRGLSAQIQLPASDPSSTSLIFGLEDDEAYIYLGGTAKDFSSGSLNEADTGLQLGHTGNYGWKPYSLVRQGSGENGSAAPEGNSDMIAAGQAITATFQAPGLPINATQTVPNQTVNLVITGEINHQPNQTQTYNFSAPGWDITNPNVKFRMKRINAIAAKNMDTRNLPPDGTNTFYSSGSQQLGGGWSNVVLLTVANPTPDKGAAFSSGTGTGDNGSFPGSPYVSGDNTVNIYTVHQ